MQNDKVKVIHDDVEGDQVLSNVLSEKSGDVPDSEPIQDSEDTIEYPTGLRLWALTAALMLGVLVMALDNYIISTAIPNITNKFHSANDVGWYGSSYNLFSMALQPVYGKLFTLFDLKWTYVASLLIFELGSIVLATSRDSPMFIVGRAIAGIGAAGLFSGSLIIISHTVILEKRPRYLAFVTSMYGIASIAGPLIGGIFTDSAALTWRFCFWINLPIGSSSLLLIAIFFKNPRAPSTLSWKQKLRQMDILGAILLISAIICLLLVLQWGGSVYPWTDSRVWGCILGLVLIFAAFIALQIRKKDFATIPPRILTQRTVAACCAYTVFSTMSINVHAYFLPIFFQAVKGTTAAKSGIYTLPYLISNTIATLGIGHLVTLTGVYVPFMWLGGSLVTIGSGLIYTLTLASPAGQWIGYQIVCGAGIGIAAQLPFTAVQVALSGDDISIGSALTGFFMQMGGTLSISIAQNIFSNKVLNRMAEEGLNANAILRAGLTGWSTVIPASQFDNIRHAYNYALSRAFILPIMSGGIALIASIFVEWRSLKMKKDVTSTTDSSVDTQSTGEKNE